LIALFISKQVKVFHISDREILTDARKFLNSPDVDSKATSKEITDKIITIAGKYVRECDSLYDICKKIKETVDSEFDGFWYCDAFYNNIGFNYNPYNPKFSVKIKYGKLAINVEKIDDQVSIRKKRIHKKTNSFKLCSLM
jgi:hypothetical protein